MKAIERVEAWLDARDRYVKRSTAEPSWVAVVPGVPLEDSALMTADLRETVAAAKRVAELEAALHAADEHLERAIEWFPRPREVVIGDAQLARAVIRAALAPRTKPRTKRTNSRRQSWKK